MNFKKIGLPEKHGDYFYFGYNSGLQNQNVVYRMKNKNDYKVTTDNVDEVADIFFDSNSLSQDGTASKGATSWTEDGKLMAYQIQEKGSDWATIYVKDAETGKNLEKDVLKWVKHSSMSWTKDNKGFFYQKYDE